MCKVSVIVPAYNVEKYIKKCLKSIKAQSFKDFECIVIDDGSTDNTLSLINKTVGKDARFKVISQKNGGLSHARNVGMQHAQGEYLQFIDGDDFVSPQLLEKSVLSMDTYGADILVFPYYGVSKRRFLKPLYRVNCLDLQDWHLYRLSDNPQLLFKINPPACTKTWRKSLFVDNNIEFPFGKYYEDLGTTYRLFPLAKSILYISDPLYYYRFDITSSISNQFRDDRLRHLIDMTELIVDFYQENQLFDLYYEELKRLVFDSFQYWANRIIKGKASDCYGFIYDFYDYILSVWPEFLECKYFEPTDKLLDFLSLR